MGALLEDFRIKPIVERCGKHPLAALLVASLLYYLTYFNYGLDLDDEGFLLFNAASVLEGQWPLADFFSYAPLSYWLLALFFKLFGNGVFSERLLLLLLIFQNIALIYYCAGRILPRIWALLPAAIYACAPGPWYKVFFIWVVLVGLAATLHFAQRPGLWRAALMGVALGLAAITRTQAAGIMFPLMVFAIAAAYFPTKGSRRGYWKGLLASGFGFALGGALIVGAALAAYVMAGKWPALMASWNHYFDYERNTSFVNSNLGILSQFSVPRLFTHPTLEQWVYAVALVMCIGATLLFSFRLFVERHGDRLPALAGWCVAAFGVASMGYTFFYVWNSRMLSSFAVVYINAIYWLHFAYTRFPGVERDRWRRATLVGGAGLFGLYLSSFMVVQNYSGSITTRFSTMTATDHPLLEGVYVYAEQARIIRDLTNITGKDKAEYLIPMSESTTLGYLSGLRNPTYYRLFTAELAPPGEEEFAISTFERLRVKYFVARRSQFLPGGGPGSRLDLYAPTIQRYLIESFNIRPLGDGFVLLERKR